MPVRVWQHRRNSLHSMAVLQIHHNWSEQVRGHAIIFNRQDREPEYLGTELRLGARRKTEQFEIGVGEFQLILRINGPERKRHKAKVERLQTLQKNQRLVARLRDRQETVLALEARKPDGELKDGPLVELRRTEILGSAVWQMN